MNNVGGSSERNSLERDQITMNSLAFTATTVASPKPPATLLSSFKGIDVSSTAAPEGSGDEKIHLVSASRQHLQQKKAAKTREEDEDLVFAFGKGMSTAGIRQEKKPAPVSLLDQVSDSFNSRDANGEWSKRGVINKNANKKTKVLSKKQRQRLESQQDRGEAYSAKVKGGKMVKQKRKNRMNKLKKIY